MQNIGLNYIPKKRRRGAFITHFSNFYIKKINNAWLAEREDNKKL